MLLTRRVLSIVALLAVAVWLGGLTALGAVAAPVVFSTVPWPSSADAMSIVFRRFDTVAMACAVIVLVTEAVRPVAGVALARLDHGRAFLSLLAAVAAVVEGVDDLAADRRFHAAGAIRGAGEAGLELARLHDWAERCGKTELLLLALVLGLHVVSAVEGFHPQRRKTPPSPASRGRVGQGACTARRGT